MIQQPKGSGFTNINRILQANQQNRLGSAIQSGVKQGATAFKTGLKESENKFGSTISDIVNRKQQDVTSVGGTTQRLTQGASDISQTEQDAANRLISQNYGQDKLSGGLGNINTLAGQAQQTEGLARQTGTAEGRQNLLQRFVGKGQYTGGQQKLDNLILGQTGQDELAAARRAGVGLGSDLSQAQQGAIGQVGALNQQILGAKQAALANIGGGINQLGTQATEAAVAETANRQAEIAANQAIIDKIRKAQQFGDPTSLFTARGSQSFTRGGNPSLLTPDEIKRLGIDLENEGFYTQDLNLDNLINSLSINKNPEVTALQAMTPEQKASYLALQRLGGQEATVFNPLNLSDKTEVGNKEIFDIVDEASIRQALIDSNVSVQKDKDEFDRLLTNNAELNALAGSSVEAFRQGGVKGLYDAELSKYGIQPGKTETESRVLLGQALGRGAGSELGVDNAPLIGGDYGGKTLNQAFSEIDTLVQDPIKRDQLKANIAYNALLRNQWGVNEGIGAENRDFWRTGNYLGRAKDIARGGNRFVRIGNLMKGVR